MAKVQAIPAGCDRIVPYLSIKGAADAIKYYETAFGAKEVMRMPGPDGKSIMHAEIKIGPSLIFVSDEFPQASTRSPATLKGTTVAMMFYVEDVDKVFNQAVAAGGKAIMPPSNMFWGDRFCKLADPFGHEWALCTHLEDVPQEEMARRGQEAMKKMGQPQQ
jgi:PhnB protein